MRPIIQRHKSQYKRYHPFRKYGLLFVILDNTAYTLYLRRAAGLDGRVAALRFAQRSVKYLEEAFAGQGLKRGEKMNAGKVILGVLTVIGLLADLIDDD